VADEVVPSSAVPWLVPIDFIGAGIAERRHWSHVPRRGDKVQLADHLPYRVDAVIWREDGSVEVQVEGA
jgi:hypothetical protein